MGFGRLVDLPVEKQLAHRPAMAAAPALPVEEEEVTEVVQAVRRLLLLLEIEGEEREVARELVFSPCWYHREKGQRIPWSLEIRVRSAARGGPSTTFEKKRLPRIRFR